MLGQLFCQSLQNYFKLQVCKRKLTLHIVMLHNMYIVQKLPLCLDELPVIKQQIESTGRR